MGEGLFNPLKIGETSMRKKKKQEKRKIDRKEIDDLVSKIDLELERFLKEGKYKEVLLAMGNLSHYSLNNQIYILMQKQDAHACYGVKKWNALGRWIKKGERSIKIFSPIVKKAEDKNEKEKKVLLGFRLTSVFDISQTEGKEINVFAFDESKTIERKKEIILGANRLMEAIGFSISFVNKEELGEDCYGSCNHKSGEIKILKGMSDLRTISTLIHECGHALAHSFPRADFLGLSVKEKREIKEVEAESIACIVCSYLGLDTKNFNFSYIVGWASGDISKFRKNLSFIKECASKLIDSIEKELGEKRSLEKRGDSE